MSGHNMKTSTNVKLYRYFGIIMFCFINFVSCCCVNVTIAILMERSAQTDMPFMINRTIGLVNMVTEKAQEMVENSTNLNFIVRYADVPGCTDMKWGSLASEVYHTNEIHGIIGPGCSNAVTVVARLAAAWNIPHITFGGTDEALGNKTEFSTLTRVCYNLNEFAKFYLEVFRAFKWTDIAIIYDDSSFLAMLAGTSLQRSFLHAGVNAYEIKFRSAAKDVDKEIRSTLEKAKTLSRVFLLSCHGNYLRKTAIAAQYMGMDPREFTIIYYLSDPSSGYIGNYKWERGDELDLVAKKAYKSVMIIRPRRPVSDEFYEFEKTVMKTAFTLYNYTWTEGSEVGIFNIAQYDSVILYAHAIKESVKADEDPRNTTNILKRLWNATFRGIAGLTYVNKNGDRETDFTLLDHEPETGEYGIVAQYLGHSDRFELMNAHPHWLSNEGPHPNKPKCGFIGELCTTYEFPMYASVSIGFTAAIILIVSIGFLSFRKLRAEAAIQSDWWRVKWHELSTYDKSVSVYDQQDETHAFAPDPTVFQTKGTLRKNDTGGSLHNRRHSRKFLLIHCRPPEKKWNTFKGVPVYIRKLKTKTFTVDRKLLLELKQMREIGCPNLTRLVGVCPDKNNVCVITEYCSRGCLKDILQNESIKLEREFWTSLINDIVQGMCYIHKSPIEYHGSLSSSTCVIDSRFVLKVTGFGLRSLNGYSWCSNSCDTENLNPDDYLTEIFYVAPEILRAYPACSPNQSSDVYSFAIILYEMCTRIEPYVSEPWYRTVYDTVEQIKSSSMYPLRPSFVSNTSLPEVIELAKNCWKENPEERPTFPMIRRDVYSIRRENPHGTNVLDMLLHRMEHYANNLENIVQDRTNAFLEEKKKSETLLHEVLPRSVADQLRSGKAVIPEEFENVTIYFSDIVGFTTISAASTPLEMTSFWKPCLKWTVLSAPVSQVLSKVVDFLNDVYTCFDEIIESFEVYKVETIGDAYMVVSGLPVRNGNEHVRQIARMSLRIVAQLNRFIIRHQPDSPLRTRIGMHSGSVVAGVVGRKMPRYCLFGDTVNTASRMESNGKPMMIHISDSSRQLLETFGNFIIEERGFINIKGKGVMLTHWLIDEKSCDVLENGLYNNFLLSE